MAPLFRTKSSSSNITNFRYHAHTHLRRTISPHTKHKSLNRLIHDYNLYNLARAHGAATLTFQNLNSYSDTTFAPPDSSEGDITLFGPREQSKLDTIRSTTMT